jgi:hypothetical protein
MSAVEQVERTRELIQAIGEAQAELATMIGSIYYAVRLDPDIQDSLDRYRAALDAITAVRREGRYNTAEECRDIAAGALNGR